MYFECRHLKRHFSVFKRLGIPGPEPSIISGNLIEIMKKGQFQANVDWSKKYGRVFGYFEGYTPVMSVSDPDLLKHILVKDFKNFQCRKQFPLAPRKSLGLFLENGLQWKRSRNLLTPAFSSGKMKQVSIIDPLFHLSALWFHILYYILLHLLLNLHTAEHFNMELIFIKHFVS